MSVVDPTEPAAYVVRPRTSRYTYNDLLQLNDKTKSCFLRLSVIAHMDMNAFFAQVEQIRLNLSRDDPVVCVQWHAVIAVSYAARKYGINRMDTVETCRKKCPNIVLAHAAVYEKGSSNWKYLPELPNRAICKVSLDPYRRESRKIFRILASNCDLVEKASVDEGFMDFGRIVYDRLLKLAPDSLGRPIDIHLPLPSIPEKLDLEIKGHVYGGEGIVVEDWDDIITILGSNILYDIRTQVHNQLGYTTLGGVSRNRSLAKLAGGMLKPDNQTIIFNSRVANFLREFELGDITGMGGKTGEAIMSNFSVPSNQNSIDFLSKIPKNELEKYPTLYETVNGNLQQQLRDRVEIKSMMSRKTFMADTLVTTLYDSLEWIKSLAGDLCNRIIDLDEESAVITRPRKISINCSSKSNTMSKQCPIIPYRDIKKLRETVEELSLKLFIEALQDSYDLSKLNNPLRLDKIHPYNRVAIPPVIAFSVIVSSLVKLDTAIDAFTKKTNKTEGRDYIDKMFESYNTGSTKDPKDTKDTKYTKDPAKKLDKEYIDKLFKDFNSTLKNRVSKPQKPAKLTQKSTKATQNPTQAPNPKYNILDSLKTKELVDPTTKYCSGCKKVITEDVQTHRDFHLALKLSTEN